MEKDWNNYALMDVCFKANEDSPTEIILLDNNKDEVKTCRIVDVQVENKDKKNEKLVIYVGEDADESVDDVGWEM